MMEESEQKTAVVPSSKAEQGKQRLKSAFLVRYLTDGQRQQFILEDVATRQRQRFDGLEALQTWLQEIFANS